MRRFGFSSAVGASAAGSAAGVSSAVFFVVRRVRRFGFSSIAGGCSVSAISARVSSGVSLSVDATESSTGFLLLLRRGRRGFGVFSVGSSVTATVFSVTVGSSSVPAAEVGVASVLSCASP